MITRSMVATTTSNRSGRIAVAMKALDNCWNNAKMGYNPDWKEHHSLTSTNRARK
jgi:hypothetical protein